jgi:hypothetical protein
MRAELSTRSDQAELPARVALMAVVQPGKPVTLLDAEAEVDTWRIVEVFSRTGLPFDVDLSWSSGSGTGASARVTVAKAARICLHARSLRVVGDQPREVANRVGVTVADGFTPPEHLGGPIGDVGVGVPFTSRPAVRGDGSASSSASSRPTPHPPSRSGRARRRARHRTTRLLQPDSGIPIGGASTVEVTTNHPGTLEPASSSHLSL